MNGDTPTATAIPPSVQRARQQHGRSRAWTGLWGKGIAAAVVILVVGGYLLVQWVLRMQPVPTAKVAAERTMEPYWGKQTFEYKKAEVPTPPPPPTPPADTITPVLSKLLAGQAMLERRMDKVEKDLAAKSTTTKAAATPPPKPVAPPMLFVSHDLDKEPVPAPKPTAPLYTVGAGSFLSCEVETAMNSDVEGYFTAKVTMPVYDTETGHHLLVPQGSTILGNDQSSKLIYGNERMDTVSLKLRLSDGRTVDLGKAPVTDQTGVAGLTGDVNQHYGRLLGAVIIQGVLKGGTSAMTTAMSGAAGAGSYTSGMTGAVNQASQTVTGPMLNTRPTIKVEAGQLCQVILLEPLTLPAMWQGGPAPTMTSTQVSTKGVKER